MVETGNVGDPRDAKLAQQRLEVAQCFGWITGAMRSVLVLFHAMIILELRGGSDESDSCDFVDDYWL